MSCSSCCFYQSRRCSGAHPWPSAPSSGFWPCSGLLYHCLWLAGACLTLSQWEPAVHWTTLKEIGTYVLCLMKWFNVVNSLSKWSFHSWMLICPKSCYFHDITKHLVVCGSGNTALLKSWRRMSFSFHHLQELHHLHADHHCALFSFSCYPSALFLQCHLCTLQKDSPL